MLIMNFLNGQFIYIVIFYAERKNTASHGEQQYSVSTVSNSHN